MEHQQRSVTDAKLASQRRPRVASAVLWAGALGLLWAALNPGDAKSWLVGAPVVVLATGAALALRDPLALRISPLAALKFSVFFAHQSLRGGWNVAKCAFHPRLPLNPGLTTYQLRLPEERARVFLAIVTSLLPGTLSADLEGRNLLLHELDASPAVLEEMRILENHIAALFALDVAGERNPA